MLKSKHIYPTTYRSRQRFLEEPIQRTNSTDILHEKSLHKGEIGINQKGLALKQSFNLSENAYNSMNTSFSFASV